MTAGSGLQVHLPESMDVIAIRAPGGPEMLVAERRPVPRPGAGQVLIQVAAAGVNRPDVLQRQGLYPVPPGASDLPGLEVAGEVVALGEGVGQLSVGARVCALVPGGGYAAYALTEASHCLPVPTCLSMVEAAAMPETLMTVWSNLFERAWVAEGDQVLVHGGTSGIGTMAIALCGLFGVKIFATCGSAEKCRAVEALGAVAINYRETDFVAAIREATGGRGVTAVLDMVGGDYVPRNLECLAEDGRHVSIAFLNGARASVPLPALMHRRLTMTGSTLRPRSDAFKAMLTEEIRQTVWPFAESGQLRPVIDRTYPLAQASAAHARMEAGEHIGKIVLEVAAAG